MKYLPSILTLILAAVSITVVSQKPQKTYDHEKFAKKVILYMNSNDVSRYFADAAGIKYISSKTGKSEDEISSEIKANKEKVAEDLKFLNDNGIYRILDKTELTNVQESPIKKADIVMHCHYQDMTYRLVLTNCIQTNTTWVLGDGIRPEGKDVEKLAEQYNAKRNKEPGGLLGKIQDLEEKQEAKQEAANQAQRENPPSRGYHAQTFPMQKADAASMYVKYDSYGIPFEGYYILRNGQRFDAAIVYQEPEKLLLHEFNLAIANRPSQTKVDYLNPSSDDNFKEFIKKEDLHAFYTGDQLFVQSSPGKWHILISEGAIRELVGITKIENASGSGYAVANLIQKLDQTPVNKGGMAIGFKNTMSSMVNENSALADKIRNKETGYTFEYQSSIINEFNNWYAKTYPGKTPYVLPYHYNLPTKELDDFGYYFFKAIKENNRDLIVGLMMTRESLAATLNEKATDQTMKDKILQELGNNANQKFHDKNMKRFNSLMKQVQTLDMSDATYDKFEFKSDAEMTGKLGTDVGNGYMHFTSNGTQYKVLVDKLARLNNGWKGNEFGSVVLTMDGSSLQTNTDEVMEEEVVEEAVEAEVAEESSPLPSEFGPIEGSWTFHKIYDNGTDKTDQCTKCLVGGKPMVVYFGNDGTVLYQKGYRDTNGITSASWEYVPAEERKEREKDINFVIKEYGQDANYGKMKYTLISISETEMIYENKALGLKWIWKRNG